MRINRFSIVVSICAVVIVLDQLTKWLAKSYLTEGSVLISGLFRLRFYENPGIALGIPLSPLFFYPLFIFLVIGFLIWQTRSPKVGVRISYLHFLVLAAAFGNFADRIRFGYVVDFIEFYPTQGPIFNLADIIIVVGILIIALKIIKKH